MSYHNPVMLQECMEGLSIQPSGVYVDVTFGGGGHSRAILERLGAEGMLFGFDQDPDALANVPQDDRFVFIDQNFRFLKNNLRVHGIRQVDGILADLGVSSHQFDEASRGFSIRFDADLDMRMDQSGALSAGDVLNTYDEAELHRIFGMYGEIRNARTLASEIVKTRQVKKIERVAQFKELLRTLTPRAKENQYLAY
jgi:16S rRNA (cytosine1402-N4)-methyltransferase